MRVHIASLLATIAVFLLSGPAAADLEILKSGSPISGSEVITRTKVGGMWNIDIRPVGNPGATITVRANGTSEPIRILRIRPVSTSTSVNTNVLVREINGGTIPVIEEIEYINAAVPGTFAANWLALNIEISGDIGEAVSLSSSCHANTAVEAHQIARLHCDNVYEDITLLSDSLKSDGIIDDFVISGDFLGDLYVPGDLVSMEVAGDIGTSSTAACIESDSNIGVVEAKNIYAEFDAELNIGTIRAFGTSGPSSSGTDAVFNGSVDCESIFTSAGDNGLFVWGDLNANVTIRDELASTARIAVGRDLNGNITFDEPDGLKGRITIDWMDSGFGDWTGDVTVGTQTLTPTSGDYDETDVGGGAVGLVPYGAHLFECDPAYTGSGPGSIDVTGTETKSITIVHYGYIDYSGEGKPFLVYQAPGSHCTSGCSAELFSNKTSEWDATSIGGGTGVSLRSMVLQGTVREGQHYHVDVNGTLECRDVFGEPGTATKPYWYIFNTN